MIWIFSLLFLISIGGSLSDECRDKVRKQCDESLAPKRFPQSAEEVMRDCQNLQTLGNCVVDALSDCEGANKNEINDIRKDVDYLSTTCVEGNPTFKAISNNVQCIEPLLPRAHMGCREMVDEDNTEVIMEHALPLLENDKSGIAMCLEALADIKCPAVLLGYKCGDGVKDATEEILMHFGVHGSFRCTPEMIEELEPFMEIFEGILLEQLKLEDELEKRK
nr:venom protein [Lampona murina]